MMQSQPCSPTRRPAAHLVLTLLASLLALVGCQSTASEVGGLAALPPLDCAVLVTGGAFLTGNDDVAGTFYDSPVSAAAPAGATDPAREVIALDAVVDVLRRARVFRRVEIDADLARRRAVSSALAGDAGSAVMPAMLAEARERGFDFVLVLEELQDGPIDEQGINGRWPVTFATWILLGVGALIPDHTFESRATLRATLRELQAGRPVHDPVLVGGPIELALTERTDVLGLIMSILVPPFWVGNDRENLVASVRQVTRRRLLLSLARDLKSETVRRRLREGSAAAVTLVEDGQDEGAVVVVDTAESLTAVRLRAEPALDREVALVFEAELLASLENVGGRFRYRARLPAAADGRLVQVLVATIRGSVASATFRPGEAR